MSAWRTLTDGKIAHVPTSKKSIWKHLVVMGNSFIFGEDGSVVFGAPYAWIGTSWSDLKNQEPRVGTVASFNRTNNKILVPTPVRKDINGAHWGYGTAGSRASGLPPRRHDLTGVSFVKGN